MAIFGATHGSISPLDGHDYDKGRRDALVSKIQQHYGETKDRVEHKLDEMIARL